MDKQRTLGEEMAVAVLRGDMLAAYALADMLLEERDDGRTKMAQVAKENRDRSHAPGGVEVYYWPEFRAFCKRAGILWDLRTYSIKFSITLDDVFKVEQVYQAADTVGENDASS